MQSDRAGFPKLIPEAEATAVRKPIPRLPLEEARQGLTWIWLGGAGCVFGLIIIQSILGKYEGQLQEVWSWLVPTVVPTVSLMLGVLGATALTEDKEMRCVNQSFFAIAKALSLFYLAVLGLTLLLQPLNDLPAMQFYTLSNYWLGPIQGVVVAALGVLFTAQASGDKAVAGEGGAAAPDQVRPDS